MQRTFRAQSPPCLTPRRLGDARGGRRQGPGHRDIYWTSWADRGREMEHSLSSVTARYDWALGRAERSPCRTPRIRPPRCWTARSGMHAALACVSAKRGKSCPRTQSGRLHSVPDCARGAPVPCTRRAAERHASIRAQAWGSWTDTPWLDLIADRAYDVDAFRAWQASQGVEAVRPGADLTANGTRPTQLNVTGTDRGWLYIICIAA